MPNGAIIFAKTKPFLTNLDKGFYGDKVMPYLMNRTVDINNENDMRYAEWLMKNER